MDIADRLLRVARRHAEREMPLGTAALVSDQSDADVLMIYGNWRGRYIAARPRTVHRARELRGDVRGTQLKAAVDVVCSEIENGVDLSPRLSRRVDVAFVAPSPGRQPGQNADVDVQLAHDGLHHLHLGTQGSEPFVPRSGELMFAAFRPDDAYVVGVFPHGSWGKKELLTRLVRNWPGANLLNRMHGATRLSDEPTDAERWQLLRAGITAPVEIDGAVYFGPGQSTAGTPVGVSRRVQLLVHEVQGVRSQGVSDYLMSRGVDPGGYWVPAVREEAIGLDNGHQFVPVGELS